MTPTLYDVLGVPRDATAEQISRAWRDAVARFEPGPEGAPAQFRLFNQAAETLLDPQRRAAYDEQLAADGTPELRAQPAGNGAQSPPRPAPSRTAPAPEPATPAPTVIREVGRRRIWPPARPPVLPLLALLALLAIGFALAGPFVDGVGLADIRERDRLTAVAEARDAAPAAAERAAETILSYDHRSLEQDQQAAERLMTTEYRKQYVDTFALVRDNAPGLRARVRATVKAVGVTHADADRVDVLLFVDQVTHSRANEEPQLALNRVGMRMVEQDGTWLVDAITSY